MEGARMLYRMFNICIVNARMLHRMLNICTVDARMSYRMLNIWYCIWMLNRDIGPDSFSF